MYTRREKEMRRSQLGFSHDELYRGCRLQAQCFLSQDRQYLSVFPGNQCLRRWIQDMIYGHLVWQLFCGIASGSKGFRSQAATFFEQGAVEDPGSLSIAGGVFAFFALATSILAFFVHDSRLLTSCETEEAKYSAQV